MKTFRTEKGTELPLLDLRGKDYLQVAHRLVWFREVYPKGRIDTEAIEITPAHAVFKATVSIPDSQGLYTKLADGWKREDKIHFSDYIEKAGTGAIGRALAACGFGTQFAPDLDEGDRIVDAPIEKSIKAQGDSVRTQNKAVEKKTSVPKIADAVSKKMGSLEYRIPFGKFSGKLLSECGVSELLDYSEWIKNTARDQNKPLTENAKEFISRVESLPK